MGKTSAAVKNRYAAKAYDQVRLLVKKGRKDVIKAHADKSGMSINAYIKMALRNQIKADSGTDEEL
jgi:predicted HicB family RNase H-like nuclease